MDNRIWKDVEGFDDKYLISNDGILKRVGPGRRHEFNPKGNPYKSVSIKKNGVKAYMLIHRIVATYFVENPLNKPHVNHKDGIKTNNHYTNLEWVTCKENALHSTHVLGNRPPDCRDPKINAKLRQSLIGVFKGRVLSPETRLKLSNSLKGRKPVNYWMLHTKESRSKVADKLRGIRRPQSLIDILSVPIFQFDKSGTLIRGYKGMAEASNLTGIDRGSINNCALGNRKSAGGFIWSYGETIKIETPKLLQMSMSGEVINRFFTVTAAAKHLGVNSLNNIKSCLRGLQHHAYGYKWQMVA